MATLEFKRGDPDHPIGHAFLYFTDSGDRVGATYILVPPIAMDFAKYIPPLLSASLGQMAMMAQATFVPVPPAPEEISLDELIRLAELRQDDVLVAGALASFDVPGQMGQVAEVGQAYATAYHASLERNPAPALGSDDQPSPREEDGRALLYSVLSERERLDELGRELVKLQYAAEIGDATLLQASQAEMKAIAAFMPKKYWLDELIDGAARPGGAGSRLAQLYFDRARKLASEEFEGLSSIEAEITTITGRPRQS